MAANLLLEGPDLEALLMRAHREGGTKARIVRAEKVRRGGVFGFFATEAFEVALEIPEGDDPPAGDAPIAPEAPTAPGTPTASGPQVAEATPIPTGLLGLAERADAQELIEAITRVPEYQYADRTLGTIPGVARPVFPDQGAWPTGPTAVAAAAPVLTQDGVRVLNEPEMAAPPIRLADEESVLPPGAGPHFTSLIDQLRDGVRDGRHREEGVRHTTDHPVVAALHAGLGAGATTAGREGITAEHVVSALEAEAWARVTTPAQDLDVQGSTTQIETDGSTMSDPAAERPETGLGQGEQGEQESLGDGLTDATGRDEPNDALPNARASTIVPSKPGRRRGRGVPSQRHPAPVLEDDDSHDPDPADELGTWSTDLPAATAPMTDLPMSDPPMSDPLMSDVPMSDLPMAMPPAISLADETVPVAGAHRAPEAGIDDEFDDQPRKASWWRLGRKRREDVTQEARLWTPSDETVEPMSHGDVDHHPAERIEPGKEIGSLAPLESIEPVEPVESVPEQRAETAPAALAPLKPLSPPPGFEPLIATAEVHHTVEDDDLLAELGVERSTAGRVPVQIAGQIAGQVPEARTGGFTAAALQGAPAMPATSVIEDGDELAEDRQTLRDLGIPAAWTRRLQPGDRFTSVLGILDRMPELEISPDSAVIAVVGSPDVVQLEAHRTALDLPADGQPRAVTVVPAGEGAGHRAALAAANAIRPVVVAVPIAPGTDPAAVRATVAALQADAVIAVVDASLSAQEMVEYFDSLERVDAVAMDGALEAEQPAAVLALDVPVVRLDGISMDRVGWAALLCAQLAARNLVAVGAEAL